MNYLFQKVSYLQGLAEGLGVDEATNEGKLLLQIIDVLGEFTEAMDEIVEDQIDLEEYVSFIDEDLSDVEDELYDDYEDFEDFDDLDEFEGFELYDECLDCEDSSDSDEE